MSGIPARADWLTPEELARASSLADPVARRRLLARRTWLRQVLARSLDAEPGSLRLRCPAGRPVLDGGPSFSAAASHDLALVAVAEGLCRLGVDVESTGRFPLARQALGLPRLGQAVRAWVRAEALLKADGLSLAALDRSAARLLATRNRNHGLRLLDLSLEGGRGAVAAPLRCQVSLRGWDPVTGATTPR